MPLSTTWQTYCRLLPFLAALVVALSGAAPAGV